MRFAVLPILFLLVACSVDTTPQVDPERGPLIILGDTGGNPYEYAALYEELRASGRPVRLGECNSACTMLMSLPNACLLPGKRFGFHASNLNGRFNDVTSRYYPPHVKAMFDAKWGRSREMTKLSAEELVALEPSLKLCR